MFGFNNCSWRLCKSLATRYEMDESLPKGYVRTVPNVAEPFASDPFIKSANRVGVPPTVYEREEFRASTIDLVSDTNLKCVVRSKCQAEQSQYLSQSKSSKRLISRVIKKEREIAYE